MKAKIYTTDNCKFCTAAIVLLKSAGMFVQTIRINKTTPENIIEQFKTECPGAKTVPQIFINGKYIGGYEDLLTVKLEIPEDPKNKFSVIEKVL